MKEYLFWVVPLSYISLFAVKRWSAQSWPPWATWIPPAIHVTITALYLLLSAQTPPTIALELAAIAVVLAISPLILDSRSLYPIWHESSLLMGGVAAIFWKLFLFSAPAHSTPALSIVIAIAFAVVSGIILSSAMLTWQIHAHCTNSPPPALRPLQMLRLCAAIIANISLLILFTEARPSLSQLWPEIGLLILVNFSLLFSLTPTQHPKRQPQPLYLAKPFVLWHQIAGLLILVWLVVRTIITA
jgi:hypothetical protein